jgi:crossover junction endodeoxyribonuclease RuvC
VKEATYKYRFVIGFDPSLDGIGYAVLDCNFNELRLIEKGVVVGRNSTWGDTPHSVKLALIHAKGQELLAKYQPLNRKVFLEKGFSKFNNDTQATFKARGALEATLGVGGYEVIEITPGEVKMCVAGHGGAEKSLVAAAISEYLDVPNEFATEDESDACAVAVVGYRMHVMGEDVKKNVKQQRKDDARKAKEAAKTRKGERVDND